MSKNTNLSFLTDFLTADIVNSRVGMNNVSPQATFDVTGTGKFSGILTLGSTVSNGTYTYTLPSATGTLALTSQIPTNAVGGTGTLNTIPKFTAATTIGNSNIFDSGSIIYNTNPAAGQFAWQFGGSTVTGQSYGAQVLAGTNSSDTSFRVLNASASSTYLLVRGDGNVGIGTTLPSAGLEIETDGSAKTALRVTSNQAFNASPVTAIMFRYRISSGTTIGGAVINAAKDNATENNQAGNLQFWTNNGSTLAERMRIISDGSVQMNNIPIATTDTDKFLVSDTGIIKYRTGAELLSDIGGQAAGNYVTLDTSQAITANKSFTVGFSLASEGSGNQTSFFRNTSSLFSGSGGSNIFGFNSSNNIYFGKGLNNGGVLQWNNTTATRYYTLPDADGTIALTSSLSGYLPLTGGTLTGALNGTSASFSGNIESTSLTASIVAGRTTGYGYFGNITGGAYTQVYGDSHAIKPNRIEISGAGGVYVLNNVGIGATSLGSESLTIRHTTGNASGLLVTTSGVTTGQSYGATIIGGTNASDASFRVFNQGAGTNYFTIRGDGNVGIGTPTPSSGKLVVSDASSTKIYIAGGSSQNGMTWEAVGGANSFYLFNGTIYSAGWGIYNVNTGTFPFFATNGGNVLIGTNTTDNGAKFQVSGTANFSGTLQIGNYTTLSADLQLASSTAGYGSVLFGDGSTGTDAYRGYIQYQHNGDYMLLATSSVERMRITSSGNVLIGTTTDTGAKLNVMGSYMTYPVSIEAMAGGGQLALTRGGAVAEFYMGGSTGGGTQLYVRSGGSGGVRLDAGSTGWVSASDIRLKYIKKPIEKAVESLSTLQTVYYSWKDSDNKNLHIGLIAQEVEKVFPELVSESSIDGMKGVNYTELIPVIIKAIQELNKKINA